MSWNKSAFWQSQICLRVNVSLTEMTYHHIWDNSTYMLSNTDNQMFFHFRGAQAEPTGTLVPNVQEIIITAIFMKYV